MALSHEELKEAAKKTSKLRGWGNTSLPIFAIIALCASVGYYYKLPDLSTFISFVLFSSPFKNLQLEKESSHGEHEKKH